MIKIFLLLVLFVFVGNMLFLDYLFVNQNSKTSDLSLRVGQLADNVKLLSNQNQTTTSPTAPIKNDSCPISCTTAINSAIANIKVQTGTNTIVNKTTAVSQKGEYIIPLGTGTVDEQGKWVDAYTAQGSFNTANYSAIKAFYFEVVMHLPDGSGELKAKLIDDSTPFSYDGQVLSTTSRSGQLLSVQMPLISGNKTYHVQLYSTISPGVLDSARIRVVTQ